MDESIAGMGGARSDECGSLAPGMRSEGRAAAAASRALAATVVLGALLVSGCGKFFAKTTTTTTTTPTSTDDYLYVANANTSLNTVAGFSLASGALTATANSPYALGSEPSTLAITPSNSILYAGSEFGGIFAYLIGSTGGLTLSGSGAVASASPAAMAVDSTGNWLLVLQIGTTNPSISVFPIDTSNGTLTDAVSTVVLDAGTAGTLYLVPGSPLVYATLGTGGVDGLSFDSTTGALTKLSVLLSPRGTAYSDQRLASDPAGKFLFVTETGTNGVRSFTINTNGSLTELSGSPTTTGLGVGAVVVDATGSFLYVANSAADTISAFNLSSTGALTAISGSPFATGSSPYDMVEEKGKAYLAVTCTGGTPDLELFTISSTTGALSSGLKQSTGSVSPAGASAIVASY